jgi:predicted dehydrogenase
MPENQYRAAVIGSTGRGDYGHDVDQAFKGFESVEVVAVADDNPQGLAAKAAQHGMSLAFGDYRKMLDEVKPDIVAICPRWLDRHFEMAQAAAERGIHIYMEKPLCRTLAEADQLIDTCERTHAKLALAHWTRYSPKLDRVKRLIEAGRFGKVLEYRGRGKEDARGGAEDLWVLGTHVMDMIRALGGHPTWCFATVERDGKPVTAADVIEGNEGIGPLAGNAVHAMYGMPDGSKAYFGSVAGTAGNPTRFALQVFCSHGIAELLEGTMTPVHALRDRGWSPRRSQKQWVEVSSVGFEEEEPLTDPRLGERHFLAVQDLLAAIEEQREPKSGMYEARGALEMIVAVFESHRQGKPVPLPLENRENPLTML